MNAANDTSEPTIVRGTTLESATWRVHRFANQIRATSLTNAGKRGKACSVRWCEIVIDVFRVGAIRFAGAPRGVFQARAFPPGVGKLGNGVWFRTRIRRPIRMGCGRATVRRADGQDLGWQPNFASAMAAVG